jgi:hypothetical protein
MKYRIKQITAERFVPQAKRNIFLKWASIKVYKHVDERSHLRYGEDEEHHCTVNSKDEALVNINIFDADRIYPIIHKVKKNPLV